MHESDTETTSSPVDRSLCLDFVNTLKWRGTSRELDTLSDPTAFAMWAQRTGLLSPVAVGHLLKTSERPPTPPPDLLRIAVLREMLCRIFLAVIRDEQPLRADLDALGQAASETLRVGRLVAEGGCFAFRWSPDGGSIDAVLAPIVQSALRLLTSPELRRVKQCADVSGCGFLFYDSSKNLSRRWCSMELCGNRAKRRRNYHRHRSPKV